MKPKGTLIAIGGNEEKEFFKSDEKFQAEFGEGFILHDIVDRAGGRDARIEIITTASSIPMVVGERYLDTFEGMGATNVDILDIQDRQRANNPVILSRIEDADLILFSGGDQSQITYCLRGTKIHELIIERYTNDEVIVAGTSAGAVVMSEEMIAGGKTRNILRKNILNMNKGLGLINDVIFDSHFIRRDRFGRLAEAIAIYPDKLGIGLGEDTGVVIKEGNICDIIGSGMVILFDGSAFTYNNYKNIRDDAPISLANLMVHILGPKDKYYIHEKRVEIHSDDSMHKEKLSGSE